MPYQVLHCASVYLENCEWKNGRCTKPIFGPVKENTIEELKKISKNENKRKNKK